MKRDKKGRSIGKRAFPLRKVIDRGLPDPKDEKTKSTDFVKLECGHVVFVSSDMYGVTAPLSQRCRQCYDEQKAKATE